MMMSAPVSLLDREIYSYADVDRIVGLRPGTARRWLDGYERAGTFYDPVLRPEATGSDAVTWGEMVEARHLAEFRERDVTIQRMRPTIVELRKEFGRYPLAQARPLLEVEGREIVRAVEERLDVTRSMQIVVVRSGQLLLSTSSERFRSAVEYTPDGVAGLVTPEARTPSVRMDPERAFGQPAIRGVRTDALAEDYRGGASTKEIADWYDLDQAQVEDALRFELIATGHAA